MKLTNVLATGVMSLLFLGITQGCASDPNPIGYLDFNGNKIGDIPVTLNFSVAETRADNDKMDNADENKLSKVNIYIFDENGAFETELKDVDVSGSKNVTIQSKPGTKTIYAISANSSLVETPDASSTLTDFEEKTVNSTLADLKTSDGFVMVGKEEKQEIKKYSTTVSESSTSNNFNIELERLLAKVQVKNAADLANLKSKGLPCLQDPSYNVYQLNNKMYLPSGKADVVSSYKDVDNNGMYDNYRFGDSSEYIKAFLTIPSIPSYDEEFDNGDCKYIPENNVTEPKSGNTTFVAVRYKATPYSLYYMLNESILTKDASYKDTALSPFTFYTIAMVDSETKRMVDFVKVMDGEVETICCFKEKEQADSYVSANKGNLPAGFEYEVFTYEDGYAYYRINIKEDGDSQPRVLRNKFYKITIKEIKTLGMPTVEKLRPAKADSKLSEDQIELGGYAVAGIEVSPWSDATQTVGGI